MSPYVVTTKRVEDSYADPRPLPRTIVSRRAVATLDQARVAVWEPTDFDWMWDRICRVVGESGGTVPLPDGTLIEVERTTWIAVAFDAWGDSSVYGARLAMLADQGNDAARTEILDAYNAAQEATR